MIDNDEKPSVLFVSLSLDRGGTERHLAEIAPRLVKSGWPVRIFCILRPGEMAEAVAAAGVEVLAPLSSSRGSSVGKLDALRVIFAVGSLSWLLLRCRPQIVHIFLPAAYLLAAPLALLTLRPIRIMSRRSQNFYQAKRPVAGFMERILHRYMTAVIGNSQRVVADLISDEGVPQSRVGLILNGVDLERFSAPLDKTSLRQKFDLHEQHFVMITVANLIPYKGHADLILALSAAKASLPQPWTLLCVGRDDGIGAEIIELARSLGIGPNIRLLGSRADVPELLWVADVGILASHEEGFSNAVIEGMAAGLPMIVTDVGGNPEAIVDGQTGLVVPAHQPSSLANAILKISKDREMAQRMGANAEMRARELFSIESCVARYQVLYNGLLAGRPAECVLGTTISKN